MKKLPACAVVISALGMGCASAADLPVKAPVYKAPVAVPGYDWTGFYVGGN